MTNVEAFRKAKAALDAADEAQGRDYVEHGEGWGSMASGDIYDHILGYLEHAFRQGPKPDDFPAAE